MPSPLDALVAKATGGEDYDEDEEPGAYDAGREEGVALTKKLFKAWESRNADKAYDLICQIVATKGEHKA